MLISSHLFLGHRRTCEWKDAPDDDWVEPGLFFPSHLKMNPKDGIPEGIRQEQLLACALDFPREDTLREAPHGRPHPLS